MPGSFNELITTASLPVLVDFWAGWCGPCRLVSPIIQKLAHEYSGRLMTVKVNTDEKQHIAAQYQITSLPTIMMFRKGQVVMRLKGAFPYDYFKQQIDEQLSHAV